jgi:outer membrane receptor protein involved in Fe transport
LGTASFAALSSGAAQAQVAEVLITGSLIAGTQAVGVPITAVGEAEFLEQGAVTVADMLLSVPSVEVDPTLTSLRGGGTTGYGQDVQIHGLSGSGGDAITLLLIDGQRWPVQGHGNDTVDPSIIPQLAVDRIDILTAGASAVYGADAIVGVLNVILKRNFEGAISQVNFSAPVHNSQGWRYSASHLHGISWDTGNVTLTGEAYFQERIRASSIGRDKYTTNFSDFLGYDFTPIAMQMPGVISLGEPRAPDGIPDGFSAINGTRFCENCFALPHGVGWAFDSQDPGPTTSFDQLTPFVVGQRNEQNQRINYDDAWALPQQTREAFVGTLDQELTEDFFGLGAVALHGTTFYSNRKGQMHFGINTNSGNSREHASFRRADSGVLVPLHNPYVPTGIAQALINAGEEDNLRMNINASPLLGSPSRINFENIATRSKFGFNFNSLPFGWVGDMFYSMSNEQNNTHTTVMINRDRAARALGQVVGGATKPDDIPFLNVFCDALVHGTACNSQLTIDYITGFRFQESQWRIRQIGTNFSGPVWELPSGEILAAVSAEHTSQHYWFRDFANSATTDPDSPGEFEIDVATRVSHAFFGQLNIPVLGDEWSIPGFIEGFDVELGYRVDKFDFRDNYIKTPKVAGTLLLAHGLSLRGTWGKSFRAPSFGQLSAATGSRAIGFNELGGGANDYLFDCANTFNLPTAGTAQPGSATAAINPGCVDDIANEAIWRPGGIELAGGAGLGDFARGLPESLRPGGAQKGLNPESAKQYVLGFNFTPIEGILQGLNLDVSYFNIKISDTIRADGSGGANPDNPLARHLFVLRPSRVNAGADDTAFDAIIAALGQLPSSTSTFERTGRTYDFIVDRATTNVGFIQLDGIDFVFRYDFDLGNLGSWHVGTSGYYENDEKAQANENVPVDSDYNGFIDPETGERIGVNSGHQLQSLRSRLGWTNGIWSSTLFNTWRGHQPPNRNIRLPDCFWRAGFGPGDCYAGSPYFPQQHDQFYNTSPGWMQWDINITYNTGLMPTNESLQNLNISLTIDNFLDADPPQVFNSRSNAREIFAYDSRFSELGRFVSLTITKNW